MRVNVHAGHCPDGKGACGAVGFIKESTEARVLKNKVIKLLKRQGHTVYDCTCDENTTQTGCLKKIVTKCNSHAVDLDVSIHFNSGAGDSKGNGKTTGTECYVWGFSGEKYKVAKRICTNMEKLGFKNRGVKDGKHLYVIQNTKAPAILVEICFVDDKDDTTLYKKNIDRIVEAIAAGILQKASLPDTSKSSIISGIKVGDKVSIKKNSKYGGLSNARGLNIPEQVIAKKHTVKKTQKNKGVEEALLREINSWVAVKYLKKGC